MSNTEIARERCTYASNLLTKAGIEHVVKNPDIGHINLMFNNKVVMSFWARTGRFIYTINPNEYERSFVIDPEFDRGIKKCIEVYDATFRYDE